MMSYIRVEDAAVEGMAAGIASSKDDGQLAVMIQVDTTVVVLDIESAINFAAALMAVIPIVVSGEIPGGMVESRGKTSAKALRKAVKANREVLGLG